MIGQTVAHYKIQAKIGEDGAGVLYKALDTRQDRPVALRILSPGAARDRIERAAALANPNIARIHELSHGGEIEFVAMDAPEGESVYDYLERERPQRRLLLDFAKQITQAMATAHAVGIVHGPLNPTAILITPKNQIRFYDFGFASLDSPPVSEADRRSLFGESAPYISPEQARGSPPDVRSDIFSFGALLYHMTAGERAFRGAAISDTWQAILEKEPKAIVQITSRVPPGMEKLIERCLRKSPQRRFQNMGEIEPLLERMAEQYKENPQIQVSLFARNRKRIARVGAIALAATAALAAAAFWWQAQSQREPMAGSQLRQITKDAGYAAEPSLSEDGTQLVYASDRTNADGNLDIWVQPAGGEEARQVTNDPADDREPVFSPDGRTIAFRSERNGGGVYVASATGENTRLIAQGGRRPRYSPDGQWIAYWEGPPGFAPKPDGGYKMYVIPSSGGAPRRMNPEFAACTYPIWSPDSKHLLFIGRPDATQNDPQAIDWWVTALEGPQLHKAGASRLFRAESILADSQFAIPGYWKGNHIFFSVAAITGSNVWRASFDPGTHTISTRPVRVTSGKGIEIDPFAAGDGRVVFAAQLYNADIWGIPALANEGKVMGQPKRLTRDPGIDVSPSITADGSKLVFQSNRSGHFNSWSLDMRSGKESPVVTNLQEQLWPIVSPDGLKVAYSERRIRGMEHYYKPAGEGPPQLLCEDCGAAVSSWSRDGKTVLIDSLHENRRLLAISLIRIGSLERTPLFEDTKYELHQGRFSPDGRWIAFTGHMNGGVSRIFVAPPVPSKEWKSITSGTSWDTGPQWSPDGNLIYFTSTRDGFRCVWAQRLDKDKNLSGEAFAVAHFHHASLSPAKLPFDNMDLFVGSDQILVSLGETTGSIHSVKVPD